MAILKILGDWKGAREALLKTEHGVKRLSNSAKAEFGKIGGIFSSTLSKIGFGLGGLGAATMFTSMVNRIDDIAKSARNLGVSSDYFQKMRFAAERTGTSLDVVRAAMSKLHSLVGRFMMGESKASKAFEYLGITREEMRGLSVEQEFDKVTGAIARLTDKQRAAAVQSRLFGENFQLLGEYLRSYKELGAEFERRGLVIPPDALKAAEDLKDAMANAGTAFAAAFARSGAIQVINDIAQGIDAAARIPQQEKSVGIKNRRDAIKEAIDLAEKNGDVSKHDARIMRWGTERYVDNNRGKGVSGMWDFPLNFWFPLIDKALEKAGYKSIVRKEAGGKGSEFTDIMENSDFSHAMRNAIQSIADLSEEERKYIGQAQSIEDIEKRKTSILENRANAAKNAKSAQFALDVIEDVRAKAASRLGEMSESEKELINNANTIGEIDDAEFSIYDLRKKQKEQSAQRLADLDKELKYQRMIFDGKAREVEIEKALEREAKAQGVDVSKLDPATAERIQNAVGAMYDLKNPAKAAEIPPLAPTPFPTDSLRRVGGMSGAISSSVSGVNYAKSSAESLKRVETTLSGIERNTASNSGMQAP